ncbi:hypothetical protein BGZ51_002775 [Haplosporangium sp. Z 767]|nr:hypothetical protein BGZ51_002775 [Haplosporangium sp. Z 767]
MPDGRTLTLRAKKDIDLDRWYFVLAKIWSYQYLLQHPTDSAARGCGPGFSKEDEAVQQGQQHLNQPHQRTQTLRNLHPHHRLHNNQQPHNIQQPHHNGHYHHHNHPASFAASCLSAHQQSAHLFNKYLQRQQYQHDPQEYQLARPHSPQQQQPTQRHFLPLKRQQHTLPGTNNHESFMGYEIPPPRSAFIPQGYDWSHQQHDDDELEDDKDDDGDEEDNIHVFLKTSFQDSPPISGDSKANNLNSSNNNTAKNESMERQRGSWSLERNSMQTTDLLLSSESSPDLLAFRQPIVWPCVGSMEPAKAAAVDMWRRSLLSPLLMEDVHSRHSEDQDQDLQIMGIHKDNINLGGRRSSVDHIRNRMEPSFIGSDLKYADGHGIASSLSSQSRSKWFRNQKQYVRPRLAIESSSSNASADGASDYGPPSMYNPPHQHSLQPPRCRRNDESMPQSMTARRRHISLGGHETKPRVGPQDYYDSQISIKENYIFAQEHAMAVKRYSQWRVPQPSSEGDSETNQDSYTAQHQTPDMTGASYAESPSRNSYMNLTQHERGSNPNFFKSDVSDNYHLPSKPLPPKRTQPARTNISSKTTASGVKKKGILTSILKRPSLPGMDTATLAAAVAAGVSSTAISKKTRIAVNQPSSANTCPSASDPSMSLHRSSYSYLPIRDSNFVFPAPSISPRMIPIAPDQRFSESIGPLSIPSSSINKGKHVFTPVRAAAVIHPPPARPPRRHPVESKTPSKAYPGVPEFGNMATTSSGIPYGERGSLSSSDLMSPIMAQSSIHKLHDGSKSLVPPQPENIPRRNSAPAVTFLGLDLDLSEEWNSSKELHLTPMSREELQLPTVVVSALNSPALDHQKNMSVNMDDDENEREEQGRWKEKERATLQPMRHVQAQYQQRRHPLEQCEHQDSKMTDSMLSDPSLRRYSSTTSSRKSKLMEKHLIHKDDETSSAPSDERFCYF